MTTVIVDEDFVELSYEILDGEPYLHATVAQWSREVKRECKEIFEDVKIMLKQDGYTKLYSASYPENKKLQKFLIMFGFTIENQDRTFMLYSQEL